MLQYILLLSGLLLLMSCSTNQSETRGSLGQDNTSHANETHISKDHDNKTILSYVRAYLLIGNIKKAEQHFLTLSQPELISGASLVKAELSAAKQDSVGAQQAFLFAITNEQFNDVVNKGQVSANLLEYFCVEKKWPALQGYGGALIANETYKSGSLIRSKNIPLTQIGMCFFDEQRWDDAKYWLEQLDVSQKIDPQAYLALARISIGQQQYSAAQQSINKYEASKTKISAKMLWTAFEVYWSLQQPKIANQLGERLRSIFPNNEYTRKYILLTKRSLRQARVNNSTPSPTSNLAKPELTPTPKTTESNRNDSVDSFHVIKKGETLYQLSKRYGVSILDLLVWNPALVVDEITLGTSVRVSAP